MADGWHMTGREQDIQRAVFQHIRLRGVPNLFAFHPANGGYRRPIEAKILQGQGVKAGVPDVILIHAGHTWGLEIKVVGGRPTKHQLEALAAMEAAGATTAITEGLDAALRQLEQWQLLRGHSG
jgi:hypothetical protein